MSLKVIMDEYVISQEWDRLKHNETDWADMRFGIVKDGEDYWLYPVNAERPADYIYYCSSRDHAGYAGRKFQFNLEPFGTFEWQGPWHSNADALFERTAIDLRYEHVTWGVIAKRGDYKLHEQENGGSVYLDKFYDIVYIDDCPRRGAYDRIEQLAYRMALKSGERLRYYSCSRGGSHMGHAIPETLRYADGDDESCAEPCASSAQDRIIRG